MHIEIQNCFSFWGTVAPYRGFAPGPHWGTSVPQTPCTGRPPHFVPDLRPWLENVPGLAVDSDRRMSQPTKRRIGSGEELSF